MVATAVAVLCGRRYLSRLAASALSGSALRCRIGVATGRDAGNRHDAPWGWIVGRPHLAIDRERHLRTSPACVVLLLVSMQKRPRRAASRYATLQNVQMVTAGKSLDSGFERCAARRCYALYILPSRPGPAFAAEHADRLTLPLPPACIASSG
jgi:hypothetical protein